MGLVLQTTAGDALALARAISVVEDRRDGFRDVIAECHRRAGGAFRVGITGPPGAGKSTIASKLALLFDGDGESVGIVAVDPTSPFSGGALLGDRVRMGELSGRRDVFIRSMATRGATGGLAAATADVCLVLDAAGKRWVIIETVGVGQVELDVAGTADAVIVVLTPESGDGVQAMKAGLLEIADVFAVNKADRPGADRMVEELRSMLDLRPAGLPEVPVVTTVATTGEGVSELAAAVRERRARLSEPERAADHRVKMARSHILRIVEARVRNRLRSSGESLDTLARRVAEGEIDPYTAADQVLVGEAEYLLGKARGES